MQGEGQGLCAVPREGSGAYRVRGDGAVVCTSGWFGKRAKVTHVLVRRRWWCTCMGDNAWALWFDCLETWT